MVHHSRIFLTMLTGAFVLGTAAGTASARRLEISSTGMRAVWPDLAFEGFGALFTIRCALTLEGTLHSRTISKISGQLIGFITRALVALPTACTGGSVTTLTASLPWHIRYDSFIGALPSIERVRIQIVGFSWRTTARIFGAEVVCLWKSTGAAPFFAILELNGATGRIEAARVDETSQIPQFEGPSIACPMSIGFSGKAAVTMLGNTTGITMRLVA
jgi:hypothetical protein